MNDTAPNIIVIPAKVETPQEQEKKHHKKNDNIRHNRILSNRRPGETGRSRPAVPGLLPERSQHRAYTGNPALHCLQIRRTFLLIPVYSCP